MPSKMQPAKPNTTRGGNKMKCSICGTKYKPLTEDQTVCEDCFETLEELSNGKGDDEDE